MAGLAACTVAEMESITAQLIPLATGVVISPIPLVIAYSVLFAVGASIALIVLSALAAVPSAKVTDALSATKSTLIRHNAAIMTVLFLMLAALELSHVVEALSK
ncbi:hypothetical protein J6397_21435 [Rhodococcus qingshengii]|nr:hypothetical protein [Rhodococcus qingshengii]